MDERVKNYAANLISELNRSKNALVIIRKDLLNARKNVALLENREKEFDNAVRRIRNELRKIGIEP